jgi:TusA-related sulfurtransferase
MSEIALMSGACIGVSLGLISGIIISRKIGLTPQAKELSHALEENETYYRTMINRFKGRLKEYEQPTDMQNLANKMSGLPEGDMIAMLSNNLGSISGIPKWIKPMIPGIQAYLKENPEQVKALVAKFISGGRKAAGEDSGGDTL